MIKKTASSPFDLKSKFKGAIAICSVKKLCHFLFYFKDPLKEEVDVGSVFPAASVGVKISLNGFRRRKYPRINKRDGENSVPFFARL